MRFKNLIALTFLCISCGKQDGFAPHLSSSELMTNQGSPLGTNLWYVNDYDGAYPFVDQFKASRDWISGNSSTLQWDDGRPFNLDSNGWVTSLQVNQIARTLVLSELSENYPNRRFTVLYSGEGTIQYEGVNRNAALSTPGRDIVEMPANRNYFYIFITATNSTNYLRDIRVLHEGGRCEQRRSQLCQTSSECTGLGACIPFENNYRDEPFHPTFLAEIQKFKVLRFMDWIKINDGNVISSWSQYPRESHARWLRVPVPVMAKLVNQLDADAWFNIPHIADDNYIQQFASEVRNSLAPGRKAYYEFSNELWNTAPGYPQTEWADVNGCAQYGAPGDCDLDGDGRLCEWPDDKDASIQPTQPLADRARQVIQNCYNYGRRYAASRSAHTMNLISQVYGSETSTRVVRVLGSFVANPSLSSTMLDSLWNGVQPAHEMFDAVAIAPYFGGQWVHDSNAADFLNRDINSFFSLYNRNQSNARPVPEGTYDLLAEALDLIRMNVNVMRSRPEYQRIRLVAYEGGAHLIATGNNFGQQQVDSPLNQKLYSLHRHPQMKSVYNQYLNYWHQTTGGEMFVHFTTTHRYRRGALGHKEFPWQVRSEAPKYDALLEFIETIQGRR